MVIRMISILSKIKRFASNWFVRLFGRQVLFGPKDKVWFDELEAVSLSTTIELTELARLHLIDSSVRAFIKADACKVHRCGHSRKERETLIESLEVVKEDIEVIAMN